MDIAGAARSFHLAFHTETRKSGAIGLDSD